MLKKYEGCLIGGAVGDALGFAVEFMDKNSIKQKYGEKGITEYDLYNGIALISDDTQMTMYTANAILNAQEDKGDYLIYIRRAYLEWYITQTKRYRKNKNYEFWITDDKDMFSLRAPGCTCMNALSCGAKGTFENRINNSKGCGGVMRVAPIGLMSDGKNMSFKDADMLSAESSLLTHGHDLGFLPCAFVTHLIGIVAHNKGVSLLDAANESLESIESEFSDSDYIEDFVNITKNAIELSQKEIDDETAIESIGEGWVAEETSAIAIYCALKYQNDFEKAIVTSVNHSGDSDSTGSVAGNILGAYLGIDNIPLKFTEHLEHREKLLKLASDLYIQSIK